MFKVLIVDDERSTRDGLIKSIPWADMGIESIRSAKNGIEALEEADLIPPDILLTDVRMPKMDGIELAARIRERYPHCKIIFLSGYADKEYLKSAIKLDALNYIEKPIDEDEVISTIMKAVSLSREEEEKKKNADKLNNTVKQSLILLKQKLAIDLVSSGTNKDDIEKKLKDSGIDYHNAFFTSVAIKIISVNALISKDNEICKDTVSSYITTFLERMSIWFLSGFFESDLYIMHLNEKVLNSRNWDSIFQALLNGLNEISESKYHYSIGIGLSVNDIENMQQSFNTAVKAVEAHFFFGKGSIIYYSNLNMQTRKAYAADDDFFTGYTGFLNNNTSDNILALLDRFYKNIMVEKNVDPEYIRDIYLRLLYILNSIANKRGLAIFVENDSKECFWSLISKTATFEEIHSYMILQVKRYFSCIEYKDSCCRSAYEIMNYIQSNYFDRKLSVKSIADEMHFSVSYLCTFFKKSTGKTINDYITETRIEKAKDMLRNKEIKLYEITEKVGYDNANYFTKIFKKHEKYTPSEFREKYFV